jgi:hypothetical protein
MATWYPGVGNLPPAQYNINNTTGIKNPSVVPTGQNNTYNQTMGTSQAAYEKAMANAYANVKVGEDIFGNSITGYTGTVNNPSGVNQSRAGIRATQPQSTNTGKISFTLGGGGGGGGSSVPRNVLTPRTFPPYESTYVPPTPATPDPYNWATRDPYIYGEGLSNAGAAYDIWGSAPGTNPYLMSVPESYTPGLLGLPPVQLPSNVPSTNIGANIDRGGDQRKKFTGTPEQIIRDYGYTGRVAPNQTNVPPSMRDSAPNAKIMLEAAAANVRNGIYPNMQAAMDAQQAYNLKYPTLTPAENAAQIAKSQKMMEKNYVAPPKYNSEEYKTAEKNKAALAASRGAFEGASGPMPGQTTYASKKANTAKAIKKYTTKDLNTSYKARRDVRNLFA